MPEFITVLSEDLSTTESAPTETYTIHLPQFEGPFDLLLFFIERDELDIQDIPIAKLTADFLAFLAEADRLNIELGGEFILMAAKLMKIKAAMLLPRQQLTPEGEIMDPRQELADRLLAFREAKRLSLHLEQLEWAQLGLASRGDTHTDLTQAAELLQEPGEELIGLSLFQLLKTYQRVLQRHQQEQAVPRHVIQRYPYSVEQIRTELYDTLRAEQQVDFFVFARQCPDRMYLIFSLLVILELVQRGYLAIQGGDQPNHFYLTVRKPLPAPTADEVDVGQPFAMNEG